MTKSETKCDYCNKDLALTTNCEDYCLELKNKQIPRWEGSVTCMGVYPIIKSTLHFCGLGCLKHYLNK
jgi:hypothetical protein